MEFSELLTVPGAAAVAIGLTQFAKALLGLPRVWARKFAILAGLVLVVVATAINGDATSTDWFMSVAFAGPAAGMAAVGTFDTISNN